MIDLKNSVIYGTLVNQRESENHAGCSETLKMYFSPVMKDWSVPGSDNPTPPQQMSAEIERR